MSNRTAKIQLSADKDPIEIPLLDSALGSTVLDIRHLGKHGVFTYDPGFGATASCESKITYIDGEQGTLLYRGYPIESLASHSNFTEVCYLLMYGNLPSAKELSNFNDTIKRHTMVHEQLTNFFNGFRRDAHPMAIMVGVVAALSSFYHDSLDIKQEEHRETAALRLIAKMPTIAAMCYKYSIGHPFVQPQNHLDFTPNFLHMMFSLPTEPYEINPVFARALDRIFILHADHEQNASTSTVRLAGSTGANPFACIASGITALWGPAHGGANEAVLNMLEEIGTESRIANYIKRAKNRNDSFRLMGFGHRVYKNYDPRAKVMRDTCYEVLNEIGCKDDPIFNIAMKLERIALEDEYFIEKKLYPNVDFYSGITLRALGIPVSMFTVIFALARTVGWISHWREMFTDPDHRLGRPRQRYTGPKQRDFVPVTKR